MKKMKLPKTSNAKYKETVGGFLVKKGTNSKLYIKSLTIGIYKAELLRRIVEKEVDDIDILESAKRLLNEGKETLSEEHIYSLEKIISDYNERR